MNILILILQAVSLGLTVYVLLQLKTIFREVRSPVIRQKNQLPGDFKDRLRTGAVELSGGQQQRLCIARTIAVKPEVILMDEPASALDPISTLKIEELIEELKSKYTIVIVTHNMQQAARCSDRTAFFYMGRLIEFDDTRKIFTSPTNPQTEAYVSGRFG